MTDQNGRPICTACFRLLEVSHIDPFLCDICLREMEADLQRLESESDATGFK